MRLSTEELNDLQRINQEAQTLFRQGKKREASAHGAKVLHSLNKKVVKQIETGDIVDSHITNGKDIELVYCDISLPLPLEPMRRGYQLLLDLVEGSPLAQEILAILKKHEADTGQAKAPAPSDEWDGEIQEITF